MATIPDDAQSDESYDRTNNIALIFTRHYLSNLDREGSLRAIGYSEIYFLPTERVAAGSTKGTIATDE